MKKFRLFSIIALLFVFSKSNLQAQTTLALGDVAFTGFNVDANPTADYFSFVILRTGGIAAGTTIRFTDYGWLSGACGTNGWNNTIAEGDVLWTAASALAYGAQVRIGSDLTASTGTVTGTAFSFAAAGDQIFAIQGTRTGAHTMLAGLHMNEEVGVTNATNWDNLGGAGTAAQSNKPACITNGTHGLFINPEVDNAKVRSSVVLSGNPATDRSRINNAANWETNDVTPYDLPGRLSGLPVSFTTIKAYEKSGQVLVEWVIGTESEMKDYTIERSADGRLYTEAGVVSASGKRTYSWSDAQPHGGNNFYRIRATELSGVTKYSTVAIVNLSKNGVKGIGVYPNLVRNNSFSLQVTNLPAGNYKLNVHSTSGQLLLSRNMVHAGGSSTQTITLPANTQKGVYRLSFTNGNENATATIVVE